MIRQTLSSTEDTAGPGEGGVWFLEQPHFITFKCPVFLKAKSLRHCLKTASVAHMKDRHCPVSTQSHCVVSINLQQSPCLHLSSAAIMALHRHARHKKPFKFDEKHQDARKTPSRTWPTRTLTHAKLIWFHIALTMWDGVNSWSHFKHNASKENSWESTLDTEDDARGSQSLRCVSFRHVSKECAFSNSPVTLCGHGIQWSLFYLLRSKRELQWWELRTGLGVWFCRSGLYRSNEVPLCVHFIFLPWSITTLWMCVLVCRWICQMKWLFLKCRSSYTIYICLTFILLVGSVTSYWITTNNKWK